MGRTFVFGLLMSAILLIAVAARSDVAQPSPTPEIPDPDPNVPNTIGQTDPGPASALWHYTDLSSGEKAWVDRNRATASWEHVDHAFGQAVAEQARGAAARDAAAQLGLGDLANEGVAP